MTFDGEYDMLCFNECWVKCPDDFDIEGYEKKHVYREKCNGGGIVCKKVFRYFKLICVIDPAIIKFNQVLS
jgi:Pyruvate/2-oxoacid:ferredoxin oxidoreductase delta subunit